MTVTLTVRLLGTDQQPLTGQQVVVGLRADAVSGTALVLDDVPQQQQTDDAGVATFTLIPTDELEPSGSTYYLRIGTGQPSYFTITADSDWSAVRQLPAQTVAADDRPRLLPSAVGADDGLTVVTSDGEWTLGTSTGGASTWIGLSDTPSSYGSAGQHVVVTATGDGLTYADPPAAGRDGADGRDGRDGADGAPGATTFTALTDTPAALGAAGQHVVVDGTGGALTYADPPADGAPGADGATTFTALTDTPAALGSAGQHVVVDGTGGALTYADPPADGASTLLGLSDTPSSYGTTGQVLAVTGAATGVEWVTQLGGSGGATTFTALSDTPDTLTGQAGRHVAVSDTGTALVLVEQTRATRTVEQIGGALALSDDSIAHAYTFTSDPLQYDSIFFTLRAGSGSSNSGGTSRSVEITSTELGGLSPRTLTDGTDDIRVPEALSLTFGRAEMVGSLNLLIVFSGTTSQYYLGTPGATPSRGEYDLVAAYGVTYRGGVGGQIGPQGARGLPGTDGRDGRDGVSGATTWLELTDTPSSYTTFENRPVVVNPDGSALRFGDPASSRSSIITPTTFTSLGDDTIFRIIAGLQFQNVTSGQPNNALNTPTELPLADDLTTTVAGSYLTIEVEFAGDGTDRDGALFLGRTDGTHLYNDIDSHIPSAPFSALNPSERTVRRARLHTDDAQYDSATGRYTWRLWIGSTTNALTDAGTITVSGTVQPPAATTIFPGAWHQVAHLGAGYDIPYRESSSTWRTANNVLVALDNPINPTQASVLWLDIDLQRRVSYADRARKSPVLIPMPLLAQHTVGTESTTANGVTTHTAAWDATKVLLCYHDGTYGFGGGTELGNEMVGIMWVTGQSTAPDIITHFSVAVSNSLSPWSTGAVRGIYVL